MGRNDRPVLQALLLVVLFSFLFRFRLGYGLSFGSTNFRKERLGCGRNRHFAQQQSPGRDISSVDRTPGIIVLTKRCAFESESSKYALGTRVGQNLGIHLPIRTSLGMASNWTRCRGSVRSNLEIAREQPL